MRTAIIVAAGKSCRFGKDKLNEKIFGKTVLETSVDVFIQIADQIVVVTNGEKTLADVEYVCGGETRTQSVKNGLAAAKGDVVAIHDGDRPFVSRAEVEKLFGEAEKFGSAIPFVPCRDTAYVDGAPFDRNKIKLLQTPQIFRTESLKEALESGDYTDDSTAYFATFGDVHFVEGERGNVKITYRDDLPDFRVGNGYDLHRLEKGDGLPLGGVKIPFDKKFVAHSDGDVLLHALMDAILSACGEKDIGHRFPVDDKRFDNADSRLLLGEVLTVLKEKKGEILSLSLSVVAEKPKLAPHIDEIKSSLSSLLNVDASRVNLSATTAEKVGEIGSGEAIAAYAVVLCAFTR